MKKKREKSIHTKLSFYLILLSGLVELYIGFRYAFSTDTNDQLFGTLSIIEGLFALSGLYIPDLILYRRINPFPSSDEFKPLSSKTLVRMIIIICSLVAIQFIFQFIPMTVRDYDKALAIAFAGPSEESFFRGVLISIFFPINTIINSFSIRISRKREIKLFEIIGILLSSILFMLVHVNYYKYPNMLMSVFFSGIILGFCYWYWEDLTSCVLAHFTLNIITVIQTFFMVTF